MKQLLIIRHAKSNWDNILHSDFERALNDRGHHDAPMMAKKILDRQIQIDAFVSSPAKRAFTTAAYFTAAYDVPEKDIIKVPELYHASAETFYEVINKFDDQLKTVAVFSHNPGITDFVNDLTHKIIENMPTCAVFAVKANILHWKLFMQAEKEFLFLDYPKHG